MDVTGSNLELSFLVVFLSPERKIPVRLKQPLSNCFQFVSKQPFGVHVTVHCDKFLVMKPTSCTNF